LLFEVTPETIYSEVHRVRPIHRPTGIDHRTGAEPWRHLCHSRLALSRIPASGVVLLAFCTHTKGLASGGQTTHRTMRQMKDGSDKRAEIDSLVVLLRLVISQRSATGSDKSWAHQSGGPTISDIGLRSIKPPRSTASALRSPLGPPGNVRAPIAYRDGPLRRLLRNGHNDARGPRSPLPRIAIEPASPRAGQRTIFRSHRSAPIETAAVAATPMIAAAPIRAIACIGTIASPPGSAPVHTPHRPADRSPTTTPIAAPPDRWTGWDGWPRNDGHGRRRRSLGCRWRRRRLKVRGTNRQERRRQNHQRSDNREKTLTHDILR
jgi:hypothetical protein